MERPLLRDQSPAEFFKEMVEDSLARQQIKAGDMTSYYLVNLLCQFVRLDGRAQTEFGEPLAFRLGRALDSGGTEQRERLRQLGDFSLFVAGFFSDSLKRGAIDVDYYVSMGEYAYGSLSHRDEDTFAEVFSDLASRFVGFADVLAEISDRSAIRNSVDTLRLYEKWLRTGSTRDSQKLIERGILPNYSIKPRLQ
jgi:hypothetical protein